MFAPLCADDSAGGERPLGLYSTAEQAAIARDEAVLRAGGLASRALLNHPVDTYSHVSHFYTHHHFHHLHLEFLGPTGGQQTNNS